MVKAELSYNPYLLETKVKFNGQEPKINSLVEKYQEGKLQAWITEIPAVFHNEMNGYDFDLDFSGTKADFEELEQAFVDSGVSTMPETKASGEIAPADVRIFFKNELEDSRTKSKEIDDLLTWLNATPNRKFDNASFRFENSELFDEPFSYLIIQAPNIDTSVFDGLDLTLETANTVKELPKDLTNTPILFYIDENTRAEFLNFIEIIQSRDDVSEKQLFFFIHPDLNKTQIERIIQDKGIARPQIVSAVNDKMVSDFLGIYPIADFVVKSIKVFRKEFDSLSKILEVENEESRILNADVHKQIDSLEGSIQKLKDVNESFIQRDNLEIPSTLTAATITLYDKIQNWRKKKNKYNNDVEAVKAAREYSADLSSYFETFITEVNAIFKSETDEIFRSFSALYYFADTYDGFKSSVKNDFDFSRYYITDLTNEFLSFREQRMVEQPEDLFGLARKLFDKQVEPRPLVLEITYSISKWRDKASEVTIPKAKEIINAVSDALKILYDDVARDYHKHLEKLITEKTSQKEEISDRLSDEERKLQKDNDWLAKFDDQLKIIERG
jgi:disulfide oxidoreductase YuzD